MPDFVIEDASFYQKGVQVSGGQRNWCVVSEKIHTHRMEGHGKFLGVGVDLKS